MSNNSKHTAQQRECSEMTQQNLSSNRDPVTMAEKKRAHVKIKAWYYIHIIHSFSLTHTFSLSHSAWSNMVISVGMGLCSCSSLLTFCIRGLLSTPLKVTPLLVLTVDINCEE